MGNAKKKKKTQKKTAATRKKASQTKASTKKTSAKAGSKKNTAKTAASSKSSNSTPAKSSKTNAEPVSQTAAKKGNPVGEFKMNQPATKPAPEASAQQDSADSGFIDEIVAEATGSGRFTAFEGADVPEVEFQESPTTATISEKEEAELSSLLQLDVERQTESAPQQRTAVETDSRPMERTEQQPARPKGFLAGLWSKLRRIFGGA